jgi:hypothetical protein
MANWCQTAEWRTAGPRNVGPASELLVSFISSLGETCGKGWPSYHHVKWLQTFNCQY